MKLRFPYSIWMTISSGFRPRQPFLGRIDQWTVELGALLRALLMRTL